MGGGKPLVASEQGCAVPCTPSGNQEAHRQQLIGGVTTQEAVEGRKGKTQGESRGKPLWGLATAGATTCGITCTHGQVGREWWQMALGSKGRCSWVPPGRTKEGRQGCPLRTMCSGPST